MDIENNEVDPAVLKQYKAAQFEFLLSKTLLNQVENIAVSNKYLGNETSTHITEVLKNWEIQQYVTLPKECPTKEDETVLGIKPPADISLYEKENAILLASISNFVLDQCNSQLKIYDKISDGEMSRLLSKPNGDEIFHDQLLEKRKDLFKKYGELLDAKKKTLSLYKPYVELMQNIAATEVKYTVPFMTSYFEEANLKAKYLYLKVLEAKYTEDSNAEKAFMDVAIDINREIAKHEQDLDRLQQEKCKLLAKLEEK